MDEYTQGIKSLEEEQKKKLVQDINARKTTALGEITPLEQQTKQTAIADRQNQNIQSQVNKLNFAEFLANRGQVSSGFGGQAELSRQNVLARGIGDINQAEQTQLNQYGTQRANINTAFNQDLTSGTQAIALDTASKLLAYKEQLRGEKLAREEQFRREALTQAEQLRQEKQAQAEQLRQEQLQQVEQYRREQLAQKLAQEEWSQKIAEQIRQEALQQQEQLRREQLSRDEATLSYNRSVAKSRSSGSYSPSATQPTTTFTDTSNIQQPVKRPVQRSVVQRQRVTPQIVKEEVTDLVNSGQMTQTEANRAYSKVLLTKGIFGR